MNQRENTRLPLAEDVIGAWLSEIDVSKGTERLYHYGMRAFQEYVAAERLDFDTLEQSNIVDFKHHLEQSLSPATVSGYLSAVRSFYRWAESDETPDIARNVRGARVARGFKKDTLAPEQARELLARIDRATLAGKRDFAIVNLMLRTGLRDVEVVRADIGDIADKTAYAQLSIQGKGRSDKDDFVVLDEKARSPIEEYLHARERELADRRKPGGALPDSASCELPDDAPLFASCSKRNYGGRLTTRTVSGIVKKHLARIGIDSPRCTAHSLRHTAITYSLLGGASVQEAQAMARHASIDTTMIYAHNVDRIQNAAEFRIASILDSE